MAIESEHAERRVSTSSGDEMSLKKLMHHPCILVLFLVSIFEIIFGILLFINQFPKFFDTGVVSSIISVALGLGQIWFAWKIFALQESSNHLRDVLNTETQAYSRITSPVSDCYIAAVGLHPTIGLGGMPSNKEECMTWHVSRCNLVLSKIRTVEVVTDANSPFISEGIVYVLKEFSELCFKLCSAYDGAYIVSNSTDPTCRDYMIEMQKKCPELTKEIEKKYDEYQKCLTERIQQLHKKP